jgi:hypothetical protein
LDSRGFVLYGVRERAVDVEPQHGQRLGHALPQRRGSGGIRLIGERAQLAEAVA